MRLQFLGSGDAFGSGGRFNTCFHLERAAHGHVLVDCGASSMVAIRKWQVDPNAISTVLVSHLHGDHFGGLPFFLLDAQLISRRTAPLTLAGPPGLRERLMIVMEAMFTGSTKVERKHALEIRELELHERAELNGLAVTPYLIKDPAGAARHVLSSLDSDGTWLIVEPNAGDSVPDNLNPVGRIFYSASTMVCVPASRAQEVGACLGAQAGPARIESVVREGGFTRFRTATSTPFNLVYEARP